MTAERPVASSPKKKEAIPQKNTPDGLVSPETVGIAAPVVEKMVEGKIPDPKDINSLVSRIAEDLKAQGLTLSSSDIRAIQEKAQQNFSDSPSKAEISFKKRVPLNELPEINLNEYQAVVDEFVYNYGLDKNAWGTISGIISASDLVGQSLNGVMRRTFQTGEGFQHLSKVFKDYISREVLQLDKKTPQQFGEEVLPWSKSPKKWKKEDWKDKGGKIVPLVLKTVWPVVAMPVYWFLDQKGKQFAG